jgi:hypothetical protein
MPNPAQAISTPSSSMLQDAASEDAELDRCIHNNRRRVLAELAREDESRLNAPIDPLQ